MATVQLAHEVYARIGVYTPTPETLRSYHRSPRRIDLVVLSAICDVYDCTLADLSEPLSEDAKRARDLLIDRTGWSSHTLKAPALA